MQEPLTTLKEAREAGRTAAIMGAATADTAQAPYQAQELSDAWMAGVAEGVQQITSAESMRVETKRVLREGR